jgi:hypothetical protein
MPAFLGTALTIVIGVGSVLIFGIWGAPVFLLAILLGGGYLLLARRGDASVGTIERGRKTEPTGKPRKASGGADTANERVGRV